MRLTLYYILTLWLILWLQIIANYFIGGVGISANLVLIAVLYFGMSRGPFAGEMFGFGWGLMIDAGSMGLMGMHALLYTIAGYLSGMLRRQLDETKLWTQMLFTLGISLLYMVVYIGLDRLFSYGPQPISWNFLIQPFSNALIAPVVFWALQQWTALWDVYPVTE